MASILSRPYVDAGILRWRYISTAWLLMPWIFASTCHYLSWCWMHGKGLLMYSLKMNCSKCGVPVCKKDESAIISFGFLRLIECVIYHTLYIDENTAFLNTILVATWCSMQCQDSPHNIWAIHSSCKKHDGRHKGYAVVSFLLLCIDGSGHETAAVLLPGFAINW